MKSRDVGFVILGVVVTLATIWAIRAWIVSSENPKSPAPKFAGQEVPQTYFQVDFGKRYNIGISDGFERAGRTYENARVLGYTGPKRAEDGGGLSSKYASFDDWLVVELLDGRRAYFPSRNISYLEEAKSKP